MARSAVPEIPTPCAASRLSWRFARPILWTFALPRLADRREDIEPDIDYRPPSRAGRLHAAAGPPLPAAGGGANPLPAVSLQRMRRSRHRTYSVRMNITINLIAASNPVAAPRRRRSPSSDRARCRLPNGAAVGRRSDHCLQRCSEGWRRTPPRCHEAGHL